MEYLVQGNLPLARGSLVRIEDACDLLVYVWSGSLWVTLEGDPCDLYVPARGWVRISRTGLTLVSALGGGAIALTSPYESGFAERIDVVHAGGVVEPLFAAPKWWKGLFAPQARPATAGLS